MIHIAQNYFFEFDRPLKTDEEDYLGKEYLEGKLKLTLLNSIFPHLEVTFLPLIPTRFDQSILIHNLGENNFFSMFERVFIDWPVDFAPHLSNMKESFPQTLCLTTKSVVDIGLFENPPSLEETIDVSPIPLYRVLLAQTAYSAIQ